jgi:hypothetical protein
MTAVPYRSSRPRAAAHRVLLFVALALALAAAAVVVVLSTSSAPSRPTTDTPSLPWNQSPPWIDMTPEERACSLARVPC